METLTRDTSHPRGDEVGQVRFHHVVQTDSQLKMYELFLKFSIEYVQREVDLVANLGKRNPG